MLHKLYMVSVGTTSAMKNLQVLKKEDIEILEFLNENPGATHNEIFQALQRNRNRTLERVNDLVMLKLIDDEKPQVRGKKKPCVLTEKGKMELMKHNIDSLKEILSSMEKLTASVLLQPQTLKEWTEKGQKAVHDAAGSNRLTLEQAAERLEELFKEPKDLTLEEKAQHVMKLKETYFGAFRKALRQMHEICLKLAPSKIRQIPQKEAYIHVAENDLINVVYEDDLLRAPNIKVHTF